MRTEVAEVTPNEPASEAAPAATASDEVQLIERGYPPLRRLRYAFPVEGEQEYFIRAEVIFSDQESTLVVSKRVPLVVERVSEAGAARASFRLKLGPVQVERTSTEAPATFERDDSILRARVEVDDRGAVRAVRAVSGEPSEELRAFWESFLERDVLPVEQVGLGARWRHERRFEGRHVVVSEFELIELEGNELTLRVSREQRVEAASDASLRTIGEWRVSLSSWPAQGLDHVHATNPGPESGRMQAFFGIMRSHSQR